MSERFSAAEAAHWTGGALRRGDPAQEFGATGIDSRNVAPDSLFVAIVGEHFDGHDFLEQAVAAGATGLVIQTGHDAPEAARVVIWVDDTTRALGDLASGHRARFSGPLVAITGSNGKTTTKEMCAEIMGIAAPCLKNEGNLNNEFGLPLTLLRRETKHKSAVVELGMNHRGEIARLASIASPTVGVITNVGTAHIEHLGSREEIALEKGDLVTRLSANSVAVLNVEDPLVAAQEKRTRARVLRFGLGPHADIRAEDISADDDGCYRFTLITDTSQIDVQVAGLGESTVANALAAAAAALGAGASVPHVAQGLAAYRPPAGRLEPIFLRQGTLLIDDTYNANPQSMEVALRSLASGAEAAQRIAVLGDMGELGEHGVAAHRAAGELAAQLGVDALFAVGERASTVVEAARGAGMAASATRASTDWEDTAQRVCALLRGGDRVLIKGSRAMRMERISQKICETVEG